MSKIIVLSFFLISVGLGTFASADTFNLLQGWNLIGSSSSVDLSKDFNNSNISVVWRYKNGQWQYFTSNDAIKSQIGNKYTLFTKTSPNEGFWVYAIGNVNINIGDEKTNIQGYQNSNNNFTSTKKPFITVWKVNSDDKNITIPINPNYAGDYNYTVNWGDGSISKNIHTSITHTYVGDGNYTVKINGVFPAIYLNNGGQGLISPYYIGNPDKLIEIKQWGDIKWKSFNRAFAGAHDLKITATDTPNLKNVTDMSEAFEFVNTNTFNHINDWNVSNVTDMSWMFHGAIKFNQSLDNWDVSNVTNMIWMFTDATSFNQPLDNWDVSNVTDMNTMFANATSFNQPLNNWDVSNVTNMSAMFFYATSFNQPLNDWDVSNVTNMNQMFDGATSFNQDISNWKLFDVSHKNFAGDGCPINNTSKMPIFLSGIVAATGSPSKTK